MEKSTGRTGLTLKSALGNAVLTLRASLDPYQKKEGRKKRGKGEGIRDVEKQGATSTQPWQL